MAFSRLNPQIFEYYPRLGRIQRFVQEKYSEDISLKKAARIAAMEATYFSAYFHSKVGICFSDWLRQFRVKKAIELMERSDHSITYIAYAVGFNDLRTFERTFKKYTGKTPIDFKNALRPSSEP